MVIIIIIIIIVIIIIIIIIIIQKFQSIHRVAISNLRLQGLLGGLSLIPARLFFEVKPTLPFSSLLGNDENLMNF